MGLEEENGGVLYGDRWVGSGELHASKCPSSGKVIASVRSASPQEYNDCVSAAVNASEIWSDIPTPRRGEIVRKIGDALRNKQKPLAKLVSLEMGKILSEAVGEVQEFIDICDFAVGLSRTLPGIVFDPIPDR